MNKVYISLIILLIFSSCKDQLDIFPHTAAAPGSVTEKDLDVLRIGMYNRVQNDPGTVSWILNDIVGGTLASSSGVAADLINNILSPLSGPVVGSWNGYYTALYQVNNVISITDGLGVSTRRNLIKGEGHYFRALIYYYLVSRWGDVPILRENTFVLPKRDPANEVWAFIEEDLEIAISLLGSSSSYYYISKDAAIALKARIMLSQKKYTQAEAAASSLIASGKYQLDSFQKIFRKQANTEIIFAFENALTESNIDLSNYFYTYGHTNKGSYIYKPVQAVMDMYEETDTRKAISVDNVGGNNCINKYPSGQGGRDPFIVSRLAEIYLISAEALGRTGGGIDRLNALRNKRGLTNIAPATDDAFIDAILLERKKELLAEGFMYFDYVRTGKAISKLGLLPHQVLLPVPASELRVNPNLTPNPGY